MSGIKLTRSNLSFVGTSDFGNPFIILSTASSQVALDILSKVAYFDEIELLEKSALSVSEGLHNIYAESDAIEEVSMQGDIKEVKLQNNQNLKKFLINSSSLGSFDEINNPKLEVLGLVSSKKFDRDYFICPDSVKSLILDLIGISTLNCDNSSIEILDLNNFEGSSLMFLKNTSFKSVKIYNALSLGYLDLYSSQQLASLMVYNSELTKLRFSPRYLNDLSLVSVSLKSLSLRDTVRLRSLVLEDCPYLNFIDIRGSKLESNISLIVNTIPTVTSGTIKTSKDLSIETISEFLSRGWTVTKD